MLRQLNQKKSQSSKEDRVEFEKSLLIVNFQASGGGDKDGRGGPEKRARPLNLESLSKPADYDGC